MQIVDLATATLGILLGMWGWQTWRTNPIGAVTLHASAILIMALALDYGLNRH